MATSAIYTDQISQLPDHIIHHILSFLPTPDVVRASVLSKAWNGFFTCFPMSDFSEFSIPTSVIDRELKFANFVYSSLLRQCLHCKSIPKFQLVVFGDYYDNSSTSPQLLCESTDLITQSIRLSIQYGVKDLSLHFRGSKKYRLPEAIYSAKELVVCKLAFCPLYNCTTNCWPSLREFSLTSVYISDKRIIDNLVFTCPLLEKFSLIACKGKRIGYLKLLGFSKLKMVQIVASNYLVEKIEIDALSLQTFSYTRSHWDKKKVHFGLTSCKNLEVFEFRDNIFGVHETTTDESIQDLISNFPALKVLVLRGYFHEGIEISSLQLEKLKLYTVSSVKAIVINAPRLQSFKHDFMRIPPLFSINTRSLHKVSLKFKPEPLFYQYDIHFLNYLREYLRNFNQSKLVTLNIVHAEYFGIRKILRNSLHPDFLDFNHLRLKINVIGGVHKDPKYAEGHDALVDCLFKMWHPQSLFVESDRGANDEFMKVFCKKLLKYYRKRDQHCCAATGVKCWQHDLKGLEVNHCGRNGDRKVLTCDALLDSLETRAPMKKICFEFKW